MTGRPREPAHRRLRVFAYDPSLATQLENYEVSEVLVNVRWEPDLQKGPVGEYLEIVDYDPASRCCYEPVDLNDRLLLAQDGLRPSEGDPRFHQQMVYAVGMATIQHFERALGRRVFWSELRMPGKKVEWLPVDRLRVYPHALRDSNAYYDSEKKALLFGYFPARPATATEALPGGMVFTCLSHDVIAHEMTHAILDGYQRYFLDPSNPDVLAFHEAFADIVALLQHFTYPEVLRHEVAKAGGDLGTESLLGQLAVEFGAATGARGALRSAIGSRDPETGAWIRREPQLGEYESTTEPHARGALLVATIFDAFLAIYRHRTADLLRIATGGSGRLPEGALHPDLVHRLAGEAAKSAEHLLLMCIRAIDYCPPVDITFGDYLRALITADADLVPDDDLNYRIAVIEAFRRWGIYPEGIRSLSVESLLLRPSVDPSLVTLSQILKETFYSDHCAVMWNELRTGGRLSRGYPPYPTGETLDRAQLHELMKNLAVAFHNALRSQSGLLLAAEEGKTGRPLGLNLDRGKQGVDDTFEVHTVRPVRRVSPDGRMAEDLLIQITQRRAGFFDADRQKNENRRCRKLGQTAEPAFCERDFTFRGGASLILDLRTFEIRYAIFKDIFDDERLERQRQFESGARERSLRQLYFGRELRGQRLAALHGASY